MQRKRQGLDEPVTENLQTSPQARQGFTQADQVNQLVGASEADPDLGFMARTMALCSLPRTNPGRQLQYKRVNGPYTLIMTAVGQTGLPFGNLPRLLLAWLSTEAVRTQNRELVLGRSLAEFMRTLGVLSSDSGGASGVRTRLRNQMRRLFNAHVRWSTKTSTESNSFPRPSPTGARSGGPPTSTTSLRCGRAKFIWARRSLTKSSSIRCPWT